MIIGGSRACGKTTELIKESHEKNLYILCVDRHRAMYIERLARHLELSIPYPITINELPISKGSSIKEVLVDDVEDILARLINLNLNTLSSSRKLKVLPKKVTEVEQND